MMKNILAIAAAVVILFLADRSGIVARLNLSHPFWHQKATLLAGAIGIVLAVGLFLLRTRSPLNAWRTGFLFAIIFVVALFATWRAGSIFINSDNFEPLAGQIWFFGYHVTVALFLPLAAYFLRHLFQPRQIPESN